MILVSMYLLGMVLLQKTYGIDDDNMLDIMPMVQNVEIDLI